MKKHIFSRQLQIFLAVLFLHIFSFQAATADVLVFKQKAATVETIRQLQKGGFVIYMRHGPTDTSRPDRVPRVDLNDCSTQRPLSEEGLDVSILVGAAIRQAAIPVGEIQSSPMCRTKETAAAAFGPEFITNEYLMYTSNLTSREKVPRIANIKRLLSNPVADETNLVLVAHAPNLMDVMGYFPTPEGVVVLFRPLGEQGFEYVASIEPLQWQELLKNL